MKPRLRIYISNRILIPNGAVDPGILNVLTHTLRFKDPTYGKKLAFSKNKKGVRMWGGWLPLYCWDHYGFCFSVGLWHLAEPVLAPYYDIEWVDQRTNAPLDFSRYGLSFVPRDYQQACLEKSRQWNSGLFGLPTATGKTKLAQLIIRDKAQRTLYVVPGAELMYEAQKDFAKSYGISPDEIGIVGDGKREIKGITVGIYKSLAKPQMQQYLASVGLLWVDEAHRSPAKTFERIVENCPAFYKYAGTATLFRADKMESKMFASFGYVLYQMSVTDAIRLGHIVRPIIRVARGNFGEYSGDYQGVLKEMVEDVERAKRVFRYAVAGNKPTLIFVDRKESKRELERHEALYAGGKVRKEKVKDKNTGRVIGERWFEMFDSHAKLMYKIGKSLGVNIELVTGDDDSEKRKKVIEDLRHGRVQTVVATNVWDEGIDVTNIGRVIFASPFRSPVKVYQRIGRGLRKEPGKEFLEVIIFVDVDSKQYFINQVREQLKVIQKEPEWWTVFEKGVKFRGIHPNGDQELIRSMLRSEGCYEEG